MDQIDCYKNLGTKLTMIPKYRDQNSVFAYKLLLLLLIFKYFLSIMSEKLTTCYFWLLVSKKEISMVDSNEKPVQTYNLRFVVKVL